MAHGITKADAMLYLRGTGHPWHRGETRDRIAEIAKIDMDELIRRKLVGEITKGKLFLEDGTLVPMVQAVLRNGVAVGFGSPEYEPFSDLDFWEMVLEIAKQTGTKLETAMTLFRGSRLAACLRIPEAMTIAGGDERITYAGFATSHDGSFEVSGYGSCIRTVCNNTETFARTDARKKKNFFFSVPHTSGVKDGVKEGIAATIHILKNMKRLKSVHNALADFKLTMEQAREIARKSLLTCIVSNYDENAERTDIQKRSDSKALDLIVDLFELEQIRCGAWYPVVQNAELLNQAISDYICNNPSQTRMRKGNTAEDVADRLLWSQTVGEKAEVKSNVLDLIVANTVGENIWQTTSQTWQ